MKKRFNRSGIETGDDEACKARELPSGLMQDAGQNGGIKFISRSDRALIHRPLTHPSTAITARQLEQSSNLLFSREMQTQTSADQRFRHFAVSLENYAFELQRSFTGEQKMGVRSATENLNGLSLVHSAEDVIMIAEWIGQRNPRKNIMTFRKSKKEFRRRWPLIE